MMTRANVRDRLRERLSACPEVLAAWEAGSAAFGRDDEHSDLDVGVLVRAGGNESVWAAVDRAFQELGGVEFRWSELNPLLPGIDKRVFRPRGAARWFQVDIGVFPETATELHIQPERHGRVKVLVDREGRLNPPAWDEAAHQRRMGEALHQNLMKWRAYHGWFRKELARGRPTDAFAFYFHTALAPLLAVLGMRYRPSRWDFGLRYVRDEFPPEVADVLERLCYVPEPSALEERFAECDRLMERTVGELRERGIVAIDPRGADIPAPG
jgi:predicted nucleotidyltransferase